MIYLKTNENGEVETMKVDGKVVTELGKELGALFGAERLTRMVLGLQVYGWLERRAADLPPWMIEEANHLFGSETLMNQPKVSNIANHRRKKKLIKKAVACKKK